VGDATTRGRGKNAMEEGVGRMSGRLRVRVRVREGGCRAEGATKMKLEEEWSGWQVDRALRDLRAKPVSLL
jgi:hypothetical protein